MTEMFPQPDAPKRGVPVEQIHHDRTQLATQVVSALYQAYSSPYSANTVSYPRSSRYFGIDHQTKAPYSWRRADDVFKRLIELDWILVTDAVRDEKHTRIEAKGILREVFEDVGLVWFPQLPIPKSRTVLLRDVKRRNGKAIRVKHKTQKIWLNAPLTDEVKRMQDNLYEINSFLAKQCISLDLDDYQLKELAESMKKKNQQDNNDEPDDSESDCFFDPRRVQLVRIFARGSMEKGGRFYRGWWQQIPSEHRPHIRINDRNTVEIDYSALHPRLMYAKAGVDYPAEQDPYDLGLPSWEGEDDPRRDIIKEAMNALPNDEDDIYSLNKAKQEALGLTNEEFHERLQEYHPAIYDSLLAADGLVNQRLDSDIAEKVMLELIRDGVPCLPIHDSFIVTAGHNMNLEDLLRDCFAKATGYDIKVTKDIIKQRDHFNMPAAEVELLSRDPTNTIVNGADLIDEIEASLNSKNTMDIYVQHYYQNRDQQ